MAEHMLSSCLHLSICERESCLCCTGVEGGNELEVWAEERGWLEGGNSFGNLRG